MRRAVLIPVLLSLNACGLKAPEVTAPKAKPAGSAGLQSLCAQGSEGECGAVEVTLTRNGDDDRWIYWKAGAPAMTYRPSPQFVASDAWDMRVTTHFPLIGSNGGKTAEDEGVPGGKAAFAVMPDSEFGKVPASAAEVAGLAFVDDRLEALEYGGVKLGSEYQNPLVNAIGPGLLKSYSLRDHSVELSQRVFILRAVDGGSYFAIRFHSYSRRDRVAAFQWRRLR